MRIEKNEKIGNIPMVKIRDYFKCLRPASISKEGLRKYFGLNFQDCDLLINELLQNGFIVLADETLQDDEYQLTTKGQALCAARCVSPMNKEKADKVFNEFMQRVEEINNNDYYLFKVEKLLLFGSYLNPENSDYGDIDIAFELKRKIKDYAEHEKVNKKRVQEAWEKGKVFSSFIDELGYSELEVILKLKNRCRYLSLHPMTDEILEIAEHKQIYPVC
jgi:predicted nucleotidyltransferase